MFWTYHVVTELLLFILYASQCMGHLYNIVVRERDFNTHFFSTVVRLVPIVSKPDEKQLSIGAGC